MGTTAPLDFLFTTFDGGGNVSPIMAVIEKLISRGHRVRVMSDEVNRDEAESAGAEFIAWHRAPSKPVRDRDLDARDWAAPTPEQGLREMVELFLCGLALAYAEDVIAELERRSADLVVNFDMVLGVMTGCEARRQKLALLSTCISMFPLPGIPPFGAGLAPAKNDADRALHSDIAAAASRLFDSGLQTLNAARAALGLPPSPTFSIRPTPRSCVCLGPHAHSTSSREARPITLATSVRSSATPSGLGLGLPLGRPTTGDRWSWSVSRPASRITPRAYSA